MGNFPWDAVWAFLFSSKIPQGALLGCGFSLNSPKAFVVFAKLVVRIHRSDLFNVVKNVFLCSEMLTKVWTCLKNSNCSMHHVCVMTDSLLSILSCWHFNTFCKNKSHWINNNNTKSQPIGVRLSLPNTSFLGIPTSHVSKVILFISVFSPKSPLI